MIEDPRDLEARRPVPGGWRHNISRIFGFRGLFLRGASKFAQFVMLFVSEFSEALLFSPSAARRDQQPSDP